MTGSSLLSRYRLTRTVAIGAFVVTAIAAAVSIQVSRQMASSQLQEMVERQGAALSRTAAGMPWQRFAYFIEASARLETGEIDAYWQTEDLRRDLGDLLAGTDVLKVRLHDAGGRTVFSTEDSEIGSDGGADARLGKALAGDSASRLTFAERWVLSSYVPLRSPGADGAEGGVVEIHSDVSDLEPYLAQAGAGGTGLIAAAFAAVFVLLLAVVWLADRRLLREKEARLGPVAQTARIPPTEQPELELMGHLSHEIRTPLNTILGFAETIKDGLFGPLGNARYVEYSSDIYDSGQHLLKIVNDALDIADLEAGRLAADNGPVDLMETARGAIGSLADQAEAAGIEVRLEAPADIGRIVSDSQRIRQVLVNLLSNSLKFTPPGGSATLTMERAAPSGAVRFRVSDTGIGMKHDEIPFALSPFSQIDVSITNKRRGSGLGLPLSRRLVGLLGGDLELESELGIGTTVSFTLPDRAEAASGFAAASAA